MKLNMYTRPLTINFSKIKELSWVFNIVFGFGILFYLCKLILRFDDFLFFWEFLDNHVKVNSYLNIFFFVCFMYGLRLIKVSKLAIFYISLIYFIYKVLTWSFFTSPYIGYHEFKNGVGLYLEKSGGGAIGIDYLTIICTEPLLSGVLKSRNRVGNFKHVSTAKFETGNNVELIITFYKENDIEQLSMDAYKNGCEQNINV